jgi:amidase
VHYLTLAEIARLIHRRAISPVEVVQTQLSRIRELEPSLHACAVVLEHSAFMEACAAESEILASNYRGPLHGVPITVKDLFFTTGVRTQGGLKFLANHVPEFDASVVRQLKEAGAILIAKLHTTEGAMDGYHRTFPIPRNPWGGDRWPGVSSSGSGVAVAAGMCYASIGTDTGGSVRIPAAANGIVGLKPTRGAISTEGVLPLAPSLDDAGILARSVEDVALLLQGLAPLDIQTTGMEGLRIGFEEKLCSDGVEPCVADAIGRGLSVFEERGARIVPASLPMLDEVCRIWQTIAAREAAFVHRETFPSRRAEYGEGFRAFLDQGCAVSEEAFHEALMLRAEWSAKVAECFREFDVLVCPGLPGGAFQYIPEDAYCGPDPTTGKSDGIPSAYLAAMNRIMMPFNLCGYPALSLPCGISPAGMPLSMQLVARPHAEPLLLWCGIAFEQETPWHLERPPI